MEQKKYSNIKATLAITKASLISIMQNKSSIFFGFMFPLIFIIAFGFLGGNGVSFDIAVREGTDENTVVYKTLKEIETFEFKDDLSNEEINNQLKLGKLDAVISIKNNNDLLLETTAAEPQNGATINSIISGVVDKLNIEFLKHETQTQKLPVTLTSKEVSGRKYQNIDFILPGQLGFALLGSGVFSTAFLFLDLRNRLVLKRFFATPVRKSSILIGEALSRLIYAVLQAVVIISVGYFLFDFTLINGIATFIQMVILSAIGLIVFLGFGFVISSLAKDENGMAPLANLITMPQFILSGSFFPIETFPSWLQPISKALPLTYLNNAMRAVAFDGKNIFDLGKEIGILTIWAIIIYLIAIKVFKCES